MNFCSKTRNESLALAIHESPFGSISRLAEHLGIHYRNVQSYVKREREPIDRHGYVKYDAVAICEALGQDVKTLFPDECAGRVYRFYDGKHPGEYGPRMKKITTRRYFPERGLTDAQAQAMIDLLKIKPLVADDQVKPLAEELICRLKPEEYEVFTQIAFENASVAEIEEALGIGSRAVRARYQNTLKRLNSPATMGFLKDVAEGREALPSCDSRFDFNMLGVIHGRVVLTGTVRKELRRFQEATGKGGAALLKDAKARGQEIPDGLQPNMITQWLNGATKSAHLEHLSFVIEVWRACENQEISWHDLDEERSSQLAPYREAGLLPSRLFKDAEDKPSDLTPAMISSWVNRKVARVRVDHWDWVNERCKTLIDADNCRVPITDETIATLERLREASGVGQTELIRGANDSPKGLTPTMITAWMNGNVVTARRDFLHYAIERWTALVKKGP